MKKYIQFVLFLLPIYTPLPADETLKVGIRNSPPFTLKTHDGNWSGPAVWLIERISHDLGKTPVYTELTIPEIFEGLKNNELDAGVAALSITSDREEIVDFTHSYFEGGIGIAVQQKDTEMWLLAIRNIFSLRFLQLAFSLLLMLGIVGFCMWLLEHKKNRDQFASRPLRGLGDGIWWGVVTMTTVGYGDKAPISPGGRLLAIIWMFTAIIITASFTAGFASSLTRDSLSGRIQTPADLIRAKTATVAGSTSEDWLKEMRIPYHTSDSIQELLYQLHKGEVAAVVFDKPIMEYYVKRDRLHDIRILEPHYTRESYGIALPLDSPLRNRINVLLLEEINSDRWQDEFYKITRKR